MSENKSTPLEVVERYCDRYVEYRTAFGKDPYNPQDMQNNLKEIADSGIDLESDEFMEKMIDLAIEKPQRIADVNNAAFKFVMFADFYLLTQEEELPENIAKEYDSVPVEVKDSIKMYNSIKDGKFVKNEEQEVSPEMRQYFKDIIKQVNT